MADKIAVLRKGVLEQFGCPLDLFNAPCNRFVAGFIGSPAMNFAAGVVQGTAVRLDAGPVVPFDAARFDTNEGQRVTFGIRASHLTVDHSGPLTMNVRKVEQLGAESYLYGTLTDATPVTVHQTGQVAVAEGTAVNLSPDQTLIHLFDATSELSLRKNGTPQ